MMLKWCYGCDKEKLLREFYGPSDHKNSLCMTCFDKAMQKHDKEMGFSGMED